MDCVDFATSNIVSLLIGVASSFVSWWLLFHWMTPDIEFSPFIGRVPRRGGSGYSYRIKIRNLGRRAIIGVEVHARLWISWKGDGNWVGTYIPFSGEGDAKYEVPLLGRGRNRVLSFFINAVEGFRTNPAYPQAFRDKASARTLRMEDVLSLGEEAYVRVYVSGYDSFSGARRVFESRELRLSDIYANLFDRRGVGLGVPADQVATSGQETPSEDLS